MFLVLIWTFSFGITRISQLAVFIKFCDCEFNIFEKLIELVRVYVTTTSWDIFERVEKGLLVYGLDLSQLSCLFTDGAVNKKGVLK